MAVNGLSISARQHRRLIIGGPELQISVAKWATRHLPHLQLSHEYDSQGRCRPLFSALGLLEKGPPAKLLAAVMYEGYNGHNVNLHVAALPGAYWATRSFLGEVFRYAFDQLGCRRVTGKTPASNHGSLRLQEKLGFVREGIVREGMPDGEDLVITGMLRKECRWLEGGKDDFEILVR